MSAIDIFAGLAVAAFFCGVAGLFLWGAHEWFTPSHSGRLRGRRAVRVGCECGWQGDDIDVGADGWCPECRVLPVELRP